MSPDQKRESTEYKLRKLLKEYIELDHFIWLRPFIRPSSVCSYRHIRQWTNVFDKWPEVQEEAPASEIRRLALREILLTYYELGDGKNIDAIIKPGGLAEG